MDTAYTLAYPTQGADNMIELNQGGFKDSYSGDLALDRKRDLLYVIDQANFRLVIFDTRKRRLVKPGRQVAAYQSRCTPTTDEAFPPSTRAVFWRGATARRSRPRISTRPDSPVTGSVFRWRAICSGSTGRMKWSMWPMMGRSNFWAPAGPMAWRSGVFKESSKRIFDESV